MGYLMSSQMYNNCIKNTNLLKYIQYNKKGAVGRFQKVHIMTTKVWPSTCIETNIITQLCVDGARN